MGAWRPLFPGPEEYEKWNPVHHVTKWKTPMLVITSEKDFRIPYTQGLAAFTALQRRNIPSQLLVFPDENHWVLKGANSVQWHQTVFNWLGSYLEEISGIPLARHPGLDPGSISATAGMDAGSRPA